MILYEHGHYRSVPVVTEQQRALNNELAALTPEQRQAVEEIVSQVGLSGKSQIADLAERAEWDPNAGAPIPIRQWVDDTYYLGETADTLFPLLKEDMVELFEGDYYECILCLHPKTRIPLLDGTTPTIKQLADRWRKDPKPFWVYSYTDGDIRPARAIEPRKTGVDDYYKVTLDDGTTFTGNARHQMVMRDGSKRMIKDMRPGDSIMPFKTRLSSTGSRRGYEQIEGLDGKWRFTHRLVAESLCEKEVGDEDTVHHKDFDKLNNCPENLLWTYFLAHSRMHSELTRRRNLEGLASAAGKLAWKHRSKEAKVGFSQMMAARNKAMTVARRNDITLELIRGCGAKTLRQAADILECSGSRIRKILKSNGLTTRDVFGPAWRRGRRNKVSQDTPVGPKSKLTLQDIEQAISEGAATTRAAALKLGVSKKTIYNTLKRLGKKWSDVCELVGNHFVVSIEKIGRGPVYCMTVPDAGNFAIATDGKEVKSSNRADRLSRCGVISSNTGSIGWG